MNQPRLYELPRHPEITEEMPEIPADIPRTELRRRLAFGADHLQVDPKAVAATWLAPIAPLPVSSGIGEA
jgi:hypothetical protein